MLLAAALPLAPDLVPSALVLFLAATVVRQFRAFHRPRVRRWHTPLPWAALFFLMHVIGMAWSTDIDFGLFDLQIKLPLLLLPALALVLPGLSRSARQAVLTVHTFASAMAVLFCVMAALFRIVGGSALEPAQEIFSSAFSIFLHPTYFALYLSLALAGWVLTPMHSAWPAWLSRSVLLLLCVGVLLCGSKMGWIVLVLLLPTALVLRWNDRSLRRTLLGLLMAFAAALVTLVSTSPYARDRVQEAWRVAVEGNADANAETSSAVRTITWSAAIRLFREAPLWGTGTGDIKNELVRVYDERGQQWAKERRLNAHSQFLQSAACLGVAGLFALLMMVLAPFLGPFRRDALTVVFVLICALNWSVESMLEVQAGVVWTALMLFLLFADEPDLAA